MFGVAYNSFSNEKEKKALTLTSGSFSETPQRGSRFNERNSTGRFANTKSKVKSLIPLHAGCRSWQAKRKLASMFSVRCTCGHVNKVKTSKEHRSGKRGLPAFDVNTRVALGSLHAGIGQSHINNLLSTLNIPSLGSCTFKQREREVGGAIEQVTKNSCQESLMEKEKLVNNGVNADENGLIPVACSFDMGWQKRGKGHNSRTGHAAVMSLTTGKVLDYDTKVKSCRFFVIMPKEIARWQKCMTVAKTT